MRNFTILALLLILSRPLLAQPPWPTETLDYNNLDGMPPAQFNDKQDLLNATRYYQLGSRVERVENDPWEIRPQPPM